MTNEERTDCLDSQTLAALSTGRIPVDELDRVWAHLPECSACLGVVASAVRARTNLWCSERGGDTVVLQRGTAAPSHRARMVTLLLVGGLGSCATWWFVNAVRRDSENERRTEQWTPSFGATDDLSPPAEKSPDQNSPAGTPLGSGATTSSTASDAGVATAHETLPSTLERDRAHGPARATQIGSENQRLESLAPKPKTDVPGTQFVNGRRIRTTLEPTP